MENWVLLFCLQYWGSGTGSLWRWVVHRLYSERRGGGRTCLGFQGCVEQLAGLQEPLDLGAGRVGTEELKQLLAHLLCLHRGRKGQLGPEGSKPLGPGQAEALS